MTQSFSCPTNSRSMRDWRLGGVFEFEITEERPGIVVFQVTGQGAPALFANESGGHRWQRVPPTERYGRRQTSTITVAVFEEPKVEEINIRAQDLEWDTFRSRGKGGQNVNKVETAVRVTHKPSGLVVRCENGRSQWHNKRTALQILAARLEARDREQRQSVVVADRRSQIGTGQRGDKRRTANERQDQVTDHVTGQKWRYTDYVKGNW